MSNPSEKLAAQINESPEELRAYVHEMETWDHTEAAWELLHLRDTVKAQAMVIRDLRARLARLP